MAGLVRTLSGGGASRWLIAVATDKERSALDALTDGFDVIVTGVGKASAAAAVARALDPARHGGVISMGIAGAFPDSGLDVGGIAIASSMVLADEGSLNPDGFVDLGAMGFGPMPDRSVAAPADARLVDALRAVLPDARVGAIASVSTCSGTDARAREICGRTRAIAEAMEGAAVALAARMVGGPGFPVGEVRGISNRTGDRPNQGWDLAAGLAALGRAASVL